MSFNLYAVSIFSYANSKTGVCILVLGFSNFIWVPISTNFGRRAVLIWSSLVCFASMIWRARATSYGSFMGACVLNGIGAGPAETMQPGIISILTSHLTCSYYC